MESGTGVVAKKTEKGFGFIKVDGAPEGSKDLFFHSNSLKNISFPELQEGDRVSFDIGSSEKGPNAENVNKV
ncbi:MAG: cold shock domain-containing protein [bacterium]|nr:cold shock domain-containing protein [bacterium]